MTKKYRYRIDPRIEDAPTKILRAVGNGKRVLEVGCASGIQSRVLAGEQGCVVTGIEIDPDAAQEASKYCQEVIVGNLDEMDFDEVLGGRRFDVVMFADVLEHLRDPARALNGTKRFLDDGGYLMASIPNVVHAGLVMEMANGRFDYRQYGLLDDTHIRFFTLKSVYRLFEECELDITCLDRVVRPVEMTEFFVHPYSDAEEAVLDYLKANNPEWNTYQFIVTAVPAAVRAERPDSYAHLVLQDRFRDLELANQAMTKKIKQLQSMISWMEARPAHRLYSKVMTLLK